VERPPRTRRLGAVVIDVFVLAVAAPLATILLGMGASALFGLSARADCVSPCDGPAMAGFSFALIALFAIWILYWPVLVYWRHSTIGTKLLGLEYRGTGIRRQLSWRNQ
jgi:hypothetical protein